MSSEEKANDFLLNLTWVNDVEILAKLFDQCADEQVEACIARLKKELHLWLPENRMHQIEDICRSASLTKRKVK